ncbi:MAG: bifunctional oligoribonuclease/PAP phosphatase NrnA [Candidatus Omnitrophota bacterium]
MNHSDFKNNMKATARLIKKSKKIIIACHMNPDGDALGSMIGLYYGLMKMGKDVVMLCPDKVPYRYIDLSGARRIKQRYTKEADCAISVDCGAMVQLARLQEAFRKSKRIVEIDHHTYRTRFGDIQLIDRGSCSVGEIVYQLLKMMRIRLDKRMAECFLTSMLVETSSFSRPEVRNSTFDICSELMKTGINFNKISDRFYWLKKLSVLHLCGLCFVRIKMRANGKLAWSILYQKDYDKFNGSKEDVDAVPDEMMAIDGVKVTLLFREIEDNMLRVSLRSKGKIDIGYLASIYGGGGHHDVAGCRIHNNKRTIEKFIEQACLLIDRKRQKILTLS